MIRYQTMMLIKCQNICKK